MSSTAHANREGEEGEPGVRRPNTRLARTVRDHTQWPRGEKRAQPRIERGGRECDSERERKRRKEDELTERLGATVLSGISWARATCSGWVRDLTEEGIEPHPGPRYVSKNLNSIQGKGKLFQTIRAVRGEADRNPITAATLQDHRLPPDRREEAHRMAAHANMLLIMAHAPRHPTTKVCYGGTMILIPWESIELEKNETITDACERIRRTRQPRLKGRAVSVEMKVSGKRRKIMSAYAPATPSERPDFFNKLRRHLTRDTVMGIDANCVPDVHIDLKRVATSEYPNQGAQELEEAVEEKGLVDIVRQTIGERPYFTAHHVTNTTCWSRIDQVYVPCAGNVQWEVAEGQDIFPVKPGVEIDHTMIDIREKVVKPKKGTDLPHISEKIFDDLTFVTRLNDVIKTHAANMGEGEWRSGWEKLKKELRGQCVLQTKKLKYQEDTALSGKRKLLNTIKLEICTGSATPERIAQSKELRKEIRTESKTAYTLHQTLEREAYNMGKGHDRCTREFFAPWHSTHAAQHIETLKEADWSNPSDPRFTGQRATTQTGVLEELTKYYTALFKRKTISPQAKKACLETLSDPQSRRVLKPTAEACGAPITQPELLAVLKDLPTGKSPGPDRIPNKLYKTLALTLAPLLVEVFNESKKEGSLHPTCIEGLISVLYKKKDRDDPRNYRPVTLLNGDYKILTRILTRRMNTAVLQFVSPQQNGFVPGGFLPENIMLLKLLQAHIEKEDEEAFYVFLDMEKAFDRCSWEFLKEGLHAIGFDDSFIDYISLFYSHEHPPTRRINMNGHVGPAFPLNSGVAQGCPISPLLFLVITEPLTRLIVNDTSIKGVEINGTRHKISQYADDSTLIPKDEEDWNQMEDHLHTWCEATAMRENNTKREGQLLGKLNRQRERAPKNVIKDEAWVQDGESIRALGVPMGNNIDLAKWWSARYRVVKQKMTLWRGMAHLSLTGRNLLLQAILYGSLRFWFFTINVPTSIVKMVESDAYHLMWASNPEFLSNEDGTEHVKSRAYIHAPATYHAQKSGGADAMHIGSHICAFQAQWIRRYLDPSNPPWKLVADVWLADPYPMGRGSLLSNTKGSFTTDVPHAAKYLQSCVKAFESIELTQDTNILDFRVTGESVLFNNRFEVPVKDDHAAKWSKHVKIKRINDILDGTENELFTQEQMRDYTFTHAPEHMRGKPRAHEWSDDLMKSWQPLVDNIPPSVLTAAREEPDLDKHTYVFFTPEERDRGEFCARREKAEDGAIRYHKQFLDTFGSPHDTGDYVSDYMAMRHPIVPAIAWAVNKSEDAHYCFQDEEREDEQTHDQGLEAAEETAPATRTYIAGPPSLTFPIPEGWSPRNPQQDPAYMIKKLQDLTIKRLTKFFTYHNVKMARPNCEINWPIKFNGWSIPFEKIWPTLGTPLSDATEERNWRKMLHRAIFVRNKDPKAKSQRCRLNCNSIENMLHLVRCMHTKPYWNAVKRFLEQVLGVEVIIHLDRLIIFNCIRDKVVSIEACAFIRHAFNHFYRDFALVDTLGAKFVWQYTFERAIHGFRNAVLAYGQSIKTFIANRTFTNQKKEGSRVRAYAFR